MITISTYLNVLLNSNFGLIYNIIRYQFFYFFLFQTCDDLGFTFSEQEWSELRRHLSIDQVKSLFYDILTTSNISTNDTSTNDISTKDVLLKSLFYDILTTSDISTKDVVLKSLFYDVLTTSDISTKYVSLANC